ncbi:transcriptional regulator [Amycolatopsis sp. NPDC004368]
MTGQRTSTMDRAETAERDLGRLLEAGPFADALRAAIRARGLGLDRIRYRLRARGTSLSLATLSHWQSGRCRPERPESLQALRNLEDIVGVPPNSLRRLLGPPRNRANYHR